MSGKVRVLVVEDVPRWTRQYRRALEDAGFTCEMADTRDGAISLLQNLAFSAAIVDLQLRNDVSHKGGLDVLEHIAKCGEGTKAFAVSGTPSVRDSVQAHQIGIVEFVMKEDMESPDEVVPRLKKALAGYRPQIFGQFESLTGYLADPEFPPHWERLIQDIVGCSYQSLASGLNSGLKRYLPILRKKDGTPSFRFHKDRNAISGTFWSKGVGSTIWVSAYGPKGEAVAPDKNGLEPSLQAPDFEESNSGFNLKIWRVSTPERNAFVEFLHDTPWKRFGKTGDRAHH